MVSAPFHEESYDNSYPYLLYLKIELRLRFVERFFLKQGPDDYSIENVSHSFELLYSLEQMRRKECDVIVGTVI